MVDRLNSSFVLARKLITWPNKITAVKVQVNTCIQVINIIFNGMSLLKTHLTNISKLNLKIQDSVLQCPLRVSTVVISRSLAAQNNVKCPGLPDEVILSLASLLWCCFNLTGTKIIHQTFLNKWQSTSHTNKRKYTFGGHVRWLVSPLNEHNHSF